MPARRRYTIEGRLLGWLVAGALLATFVWLVQVV